MRALLRLENDAQRQKDLSLIIDRRLNVEESERLIEQMRSKNKVKNSIRGIRNIRVFINPLNHAVDTIRRAGIDADAAKSEMDAYIEYTVGNPKLERLKFPVPDGDKAV